MYCCLWFIYTVCDWL